MNNQQLEKKVRKDAEKVKKDFDALLKDSVIRIGRIEKQASQVTGEAQKNVTVWIEDGVSQLTKRLSKLAETSAVTAASVKKDVGHTLNQVTVKAQKAVGIAPESLAKKASRSPWVIVSVGLLFGIVLGSLIRPARALLA
jgi:hypothetical protein